MTHCDQVGPEHCTPRELAAAQRLFDRLYEIKRDLRRRKEQQSPRP